MSHGNAGNISHRLDRALLLQARLRSSVFLYDYRGYGASEGTPDEAGTYRDARAAYRYLVGGKQVKAHELVLFGSRWAPPSRSSCARPTAAVRRRVHVVRTASLERLAPASCGRGTGAHRNDGLPAADAPALWSRVDRDEVVPPVQGRRLVDAAREPKRYFAIRGAGHNDTYLVGGEAYWQTIADFLETVGRGRGRRAVAPGHGRNRPDVSRPRVQSERQSERLVQTAHAAGAPRA